MHGDAERLRQIVADALPEYHVTARRDFVVISADGAQDHAWIDVRTGQGQSDIAHLDAAIRLRGAYWRHRAAVKELDL